LFEHAGIHDVVGISVERFLNTNISPALGVISAAHFGSRSDYVRQFGLIKPTYQGSAAAFSFRSPFVP
jgi:hypothetical protein